LCSLLQSVSRIPLFFNHFQILSAKAPEVTFPAPASQVPIARRYRRALL
jgi:hypothetical protein